MKIINTNLCSVNNNYNKKESPSFKHVMLLRNPETSKLNFMISRSKRERDGLVSFYNNGTLYKICEDFPPASQLSLNLRRLQENINGFMDQDNNKGLLSCIVNKLVKSHLKTPLEGGSETLSDALGPNALEELSSIAKEGIVTQYNPKSSIVGGKQVGAISSIFIESPFS